MGQVLHGSATTTEAIRRAIQHSQVSLRALARRYGINQKTVAEWKTRAFVTDLPTGPKEPRSTRSVLIGSNPPVESKDGTSLCTASRIVPPVRK